MPRALSRPLSAALLAALLAACAPSVRPVQAGAGESLAAGFAFWDAVKELELARATRIAPGREHADFARGMRLVLDGRMDDAEERFAPLASGAADSLVRTASRVALSSVLGYDGKWQALHQLASSVPFDPESGTSRRAGSDAWSATMRLAPEPRYRFESFTAALPFVTTGTGTPLLAVRVNGVERYFWLDTGTSLTLVSAEVAREVGLAPLRPDTLEIVTSVGRIPALPAVVRRLELGPLVAEDHPVAIVPDRELTILDALGGERKQLVRIEGVIGMDLMRRLNVVVDFPTGIAILSEPRPERDRKRERNLFWLGYPVVRAEGPRGVPLYFGLDTGADSTYVTRNLVRKLPTRLLARRTRWIAGFGGDTLIRTPALSGLRLTAAGRDFTLREVAVRDTRRLMLFDLDGVLASALGAGHRVRIDMTNGIFEIGTPP